MAGPVALITAGSELTTQASTTTTVTGTKPTNVVTGDLMIATIQDRVSVSTTFTQGSMPSGVTWTQLMSQFSGSGTQVSFYRVADANDVSVTTYTWTASTTGNIDVVIQRITGFNSTTPIDTTNSAQNNTTASSSTVTYPTVTTASDNCLILAWGGTTTTSTTGTWTLPLVKQWAYQPGSGPASRLSIGGIATIATAGSSGTLTSTIGSPAATGTQTLIINPTATAPPQSDDAFLGVVQQPLLYY